MNWLIEHQTTLVLLLFPLVGLLVVIREARNAPEGWDCPDCGYEVVGQDKCPWCGFEEKL